MKLQRQHLTTLLNTFYDDGVTTIPVKHPSEDIGELVRFELGDYQASTVRFTCGPLTYESKHEDLERQYDEQIVADLPGPEHYMRALVGGGAAPLENHDEVETFVDRHGYPDLAAGHRPVFAGIDTNLFMWRPESLLSLDPNSNSDGSGRAPVSGYALSAGVKRELDFHFRHNNPRRLADAFGAEFTRLKGQPTSDNRQGLLGLYAYRQLMAEHNVDVVPGEKGDSAIIGSYHGYHDQDRNQVILFSNDRGFIERAHDRGLTAQHVSFPVDTRRKATVSWHDIVETLYLLTVIFGVLVLPKVTLYGAWEDKDGRDWQNSTIDIDCRSPKYHEELERRKAIVECFGATV